MRQRPILRECPTRLCLVELGALEVHPIRGLGECPTRLLLGVRVAWVSWGARPIRGRRAEPVVWEVQLAARRARATRAGAAAPGIQEFPWLPVWMAAGAEAV